LHLIVTHISPDLDAVCAVWLLKKFHPKFTDAEFRFVPAGKNYELTEIEKLKKPEVLTVDTGGGEFDHHQTGDKDKCASSLVLDFLEKNNYIVGAEHVQPLRRITNIVLEIDHFKEVFWQDPSNDRYVFFLEEILGGLKLLWQNQDERVLKVGLDVLDGIYQKMQFKMKAEEEIEKGIKFICRGAVSAPSGGETPPLQCVALETMNDEVLKLAQKQGFQVVIRRDPRKGYVRIKTIPNGKVDLTKVYEALKEKDKEATWFLHASKCIVLNGSTKNPEMKPTTLALEEIVDVVKKNV
jgi:hypothetical protein